MSEFRRVRAQKTPNPMYHEHTGDLISYMTDYDSGTLMAEIRWDKPYPISDMARQTIYVHYLVPIDEKGSLEPNFLVIQEET